MRRPLRRGLAERVPVVADLEERQRLLVPEAPVRIDAGAGVARVVEAVVEACHLLVALLRLPGALPLGRGHALLRLDAPLDALAHRIGLLAQVLGALLCRRLVFAIDLPGALGDRGRRRAVGEDDAAVGGALLVDLSSLAPSARPQRRAAPPRRSGRRARRREARCEANGAWGLRRGEEHPPPLLCHLPESPARLVAIVTFSPESHPMTDTHVFRADALTAAVTAVVRAAGSSEREAAQVADEPGRGQPARPRLARRRHDAALHRRGARRRPRARCPRQDPRRQRPAADARRLPGLRPGDRRRGDGARHRAGEAARRLRRRPGAFASSRPHRPLGRAVHRRRAGVDPLRQRAVAADRRAVRRPRCAHRHQPVLRRHPAPGQGADRPRLRHQQDRPGQDPGRLQQGRRARAGHDHRRPRRADDRTRATP